MMQVPGLPEKRSLRTRAGWLLRGLTHRRPVPGSPVLDPTWHPPLGAQAESATLADVHLTAEFPAIADAGSPRSDAMPASAEHRAVADGAGADVAAPPATATATASAEAGLSRRLRRPRPGSGGGDDAAPEVPVRPIDRSFDLLSRERARGGLPLPRVRPIEAAAAAVLVLAVVAIAAGQRGADGQLAGARADNAALSQRLAALEQQLAGSQAVDPGQRLAAEETLARASALNSALENRIPWDLTLTDLARVLPDGVWLTSLATSEPDATGGSPALVVTGFAREQAGVVDVLARLEVLREVAAVRLQSSSATLIDVTPVVQFTVEVEVEAA